MITEGCAFWIAYALESNNIKISYVGSDDIVWDGDRVACIGSIDIGHSNGKISYAGSTNIGWNGDKLAYVGSASIG